MSLAEHSSKRSNRSFIKRLVEKSKKIDLAIDLGTENTIAYSPTEGIFFNEPSLIAIDLNTNKTVAIGETAKKLFGRTTKDIKCVRPLKDGVVVDYTMTKLLLRHILKATKQKSFLSKPHILINVFSEITPVEKKALIDMLLAGGAKKVSVVPAPTASTLGVSLPITADGSYMVVDIGAGTTDIAIFSEMKPKFFHSIRVAGDSMNEVIQTSIQRFFDLQTGIFEAERIKIEYGKAIFDETEEIFSVYGKDLVRRMPQKIDISNRLIYESLNEPISAIISAIILALEKADYHTVKDVVKNGIYLTGGTAQLKGLAERIQKELTIDVHISEQPALSVINGLASICNNYSKDNLYCIQ